MSEQEQQGEEQQIDVAALQAQLADLTTQRDSMKSKMDELLTETKAAKLQRREAEESARIAAEQKALKDNDFEQLFKSSEQKAKTYQEELNELRQTVSKEKRQSTAKSIAAKLAEGTNVDLLSTFIEPRLKHTDEGIKVVDQAGNLTVSSLDDLVNEFQSNSVFAPLLKGNQSNGGSAPGGNRNSGADDKVITRAEFEQRSPQDKAAFVKSGGKTID